MEKAFNRIFEEFKRYESLDQEIYGLISVSPQDEIIGWQDDEVYLTKRKIMGIVEDALEEMKNKVINEKDGQFNSAKVLESYYNDADDETALNEMLKNELNGLDRLLFNDSFSGLIKSYEFVTIDGEYEAFPKNETFVVLHTFRSDEYSNASRTEVVLLSEALINLMTINQLEEGFQHQLPF